MVRIAFGVFVVLHGLVHLLYLGQSARYFELQPGLAWPDGSWALSRFLADPAARKLASILVALAAFGFVASGAGVLVKQVWWRPVIVVVATFSTAVYVLLWDGVLQIMDDKGAIGILINGAILAAVLIFRWPNFGI